MNSSSLLSASGAPIAPPSGDILYEVVDGQIVELPPMGAFEVSLANVLAFLINSDPAASSLGRAVVEMLFLLDPKTKLKRRPDVAFVSYDRWPRRRRIPRGDAWEVIPDVGVEVVSESNTAEAIMTKIREYFQAGVRLVWVFYPPEEQVYVYTSPTKNTILTRNDELDGGDVVPGFRLPLRALYEDSEEE